MEQIESTEEGFVNVKLTQEEALRLKNILGQRSGMRKPRITREGNKIIIDTGLDEFCTFNKGTPQEVHALRIYTRAEKHKVNEIGEIDPESVVPAITVVERSEGGYCYMDGKDVDKREDLEIIPKMHLQVALDWFDAQHPAAGEGAAKKRART